LLRFISLLRLKIRVHARKQSMQSRLQGNYCLYHGFFPDDPNDSSVLVCFLGDRLSFEEKWEYYGSAVNVSVLCTRVIVYIGAIYASSEPKMTTSCIEIIIQANFYPYSDR
jgi:hypothetical protein